MDESLIILESQKLAEKHFDLEVADSNDFDQFRKQLHSEIKRLLDVDFNQLLNVLYRIDLDENKVKGILNDGDPSMVSHHLTESILDRLKEKAILRQRYKSF